MTSKPCWLTPLELAAELNIRPDRVAQLMRTGLLPYVLTAREPLIHSRDRKNLTELFPDLLAHFVAENEVDKLVAEGEQPLQPESCLRPSTVRLLKCVERRQGSVPR